ncbi:MAG: hypothetical protein ACK4Q5_05405 [Saprospiraceae bacterium]
MKKTVMTASAALLLSMFALVSACKDKTEEGREVDCGKVTGATFTSNSGKMQTIVANKCGTSTCHAAGGDGSQHWAYSAEYDSLTPHLDHMYEGVILEKAMPPAGATPLTEDELDLIQCWKEAGFPK